jgi:hypothetical protein
MPKYFLYYFLNSSIGNIHDSLHGIPYVATFIVWKTLWWILAILCCWENYRNPTLAKCGGEAQHLEKLEVWSPPGLLNV